jgi:hypothetical protein
VSAGGRAVRRVPVAMDEELAYTAVRGSEADRVRVAAGYRQLPLDMNCYLYCERIVEELGDGSEGLAGHLMVLEWLNAQGTVVEIKSYRGEGLAVVVNGEVVYRWRKMDGGQTVVRSPRRKRSAVGGGMPPAVPRSNARKKAAAASTSSVKKKVNASRKAPIEEDYDEEFE